MAKKGKTAAKKKNNSSIKLKLYLFFLIFLLILVSGLFFLVHLDRARYREQRDRLTAKVQDATDLRRLVKKAVYFFSRQAETIVENYTLEGPLPGVDISIGGRANIREWQKTVRPLVEKLARETGLEVVADNDANNVADNVANKDTTFLIGGKNRNIRIRMVPGSHADKDNRQEERRGHKGRQSKTKDGAGDGGENALPAPEVDTWPSGEQDAKRDEKKTGEKGNQQLFPENDHDLPGPDKDGKRPDRRSSGQDFSGKLQDRPSGDARIALILDDAGGPAETQWLFLPIPVHLNFAVMPDCGNTEDFARRARASGHTLLVHVPMLPRKSDQYRLPERLLKPGMQAADVGALLSDFFSQVPGAIGMNNHMGSAATADRALMKAVAGYLKDKNYIFLDSLTHASSVAYPVARKYSIPALKRDIFLDHRHSYDYIQQKLLALARLAARQGSAVGIGHVTSLNTYQVLRDTLPRLEKMGLRFVSIRELAQ